MAKYMAHSQPPKAVPVAAPPTIPTSPRTNTNTNAKPSEQNHSRWHLSGFSFSQKGDPMLINRNIHDLLQQPCFMPWRKSRGDVDSFLRFHTTLRVLFEAVVFFSEFWGQRGFWTRIRSILKLDSVASADLLEDTVKLYCEGRRNCLHWIYKRDSSSISWQAPSRVAELADDVNGLRLGEHVPISEHDWNNRASHWRGRLYNVLHDQGVHSQQVNKGTCAPELLKSQSQSTPPKSETRKRERPEPRQSSPSRRPSLDQPTRPRDIEVPKGPKIRLPPKPPPVRERTEEQASTTRAENSTHNGEEPTGSAVITPQKPSNTAQSLDELVAGYKHSSAPAENPRKRALDELPEGPDKANKRIAIEPTGDPPRPNDPIALPSAQTQPLVRQSPAQKVAEQEQEAVMVQAKEEVNTDVTGIAEAREESTTEPEAQFHHSGQTSETATTKVIDRPRSPSAQSDSLFVQKSEFPVENEASQTVDVVSELLHNLEQRQQRLEALEASTGSQQKLLEQWEADRKRITELEASTGSQQKLLELWAADRKRIAELETQLGERSADARRVRALYDKYKVHGDQLERQSSINRRIEETMEATIREVKAQLSQHIADEERSRIDTSKATLELRQELQTKYSADMDTLRQTNTAIETTKKQFLDAEFQNGMHFSETERRAREIEGQIHDVEKRLMDQWEQHSSACKLQRAETEELSTGTRLADLQRQLGQVQDALQTLQAREVAPGTPATSTSGCLYPGNGLDPSSLPRLDVGNFLDTIHYEMSKLRTAMRTRIRAMDAEGVSDEDDSKLAVSDISFELGRVLEVARKRINKL